MSNYLILLNFIVILYFSETEFGGVSNHDFLKFLIPLLILWISVHAFKIETKPKNTADIEQGE